MDWRQYDAQCFPVSLVTSVVMTQHCESRKSHEKLKCWAKHHKIGNSFHVNLLNYILAAENKWLWKMVLIFQQFIQYFCLTQSWESVLNVRIHSVTLEFVFVKSLNEKMYSLVCWQALILLSCCLICSSFFSCLWPAISREIKSSHSKPALCQLDLAHMRILLTNYIHMSHWRW